MENRPQRCPLPHQAATPGLVAQLEGHKDADHNNEDDNKDDHTQRGALYVVLTPQFF